MAITELSTDLNIIAALDDEPNDVSGLTPAQAKAKFDEGANDIKTFLNDTHIPELDAEHLPYLYGSAATIKETMESLAAGVMPDKSVTFSKLSPDVVWTIGMFRKNLLNILRIKLQLSLASSDIDAWADLLADYSMLDLATSLGISVTGGALSVISTITQNTNDNALCFGYNSSYTYEGQTFLMNGRASVSAVKVKLSKAKSPTDNVNMYLCATSGGLPTSVIATSTTTLSGASISTSATEYTFNFSNVILEPDTTYAFYLARSGALSTVDYYNAHLKGSNVYSGGMEVTYGTSWTANSSQDLYFVLSFAETEGTVIWNAVTATEPLSFAAVAAEETLNSGSISYYLSDDGTNWTEITGLDTLQYVGLSATSVYLKAVITGNAALNGVSWGGY